MLGTFIEVFSDEDRISKDCIFMIGRFEVFQANPELFCIDAYKQD